MTAETQLATGVHDGVPMEAYLAMKAVSSGLLITLGNESPLHAWIESPWNPGRVDRPSKISEIGTVAHACLLEGGTDKMRVFDPATFPNANGKETATGWTNKAIKEARDEARKAGEIPILLDDFASVRSMVTAAKDYIAQSDLSGLFDSGKPEQTIVWNDTGMLCKARPDWMLPDGTMVHYKSTKASVNPDRFSNLIVNSGYDQAMMFYARSIRECPGQYVLAQEQDYPYACQLFALTPDQAEISSIKVKRALLLWAACVRLNMYPAYSGAVHYIEAKSWDTRKLEETRTDGDELTDEELEGGIPL